MGSPKYAKRRDANEGPIVKALKAIGCDVEPIGWPVDLLVGYRARNFLIEIKGGADKHYRGTKEQRDWIAAWRGQVRIVRNAEEAIALVTEAY